MNDWPEFYANRLGRSYLYYVKERYKPFINAIWESTPTRGKVLEFGCGTGTITQALIERAGTHYSHELLDQDPEMIKLSEVRLRAERITHKVKFIVSEVRAWAYMAEGTKYYVDTIHSHGVLEHYPDKEIQSIVDICKRLCSVQVHYVPGQYPTPSFGDERLLPLEYWQDLLKPTKSFTFNDGLDYCLVVKS